MATLLTLLLFLSPDVVILKNGDRITGEVKSAAGGKLTIKTDHSGEIKVSMAAVANLTTTHPVTIELESGEIIAGKIRFLEGGELSVEISDGSTVLVPWDGIKAINPPLKESFKGGIALGGTSARGNVDRITASLAVRHGGDVGGSDWGVDRGGAHPGR